MHGQSHPSCQLVVLKSNNEIFFDAHFVFICVKSFNKVHSQLCSILLGLGQPTSQMCNLDFGNFDFGFAQKITLELVSRYFTKVPS